MNKISMKELLQKFKNGEITEDEILLKLREKPFEDIAYANIDYQRELRQGIPEVIFGLRKTPEQIEGIVRNMMQHNRENILITRLNNEAYTYLADKIPIHYEKNAKIGIVNERKIDNPIGNIAVITAGTSDIPIAEEAAITAEIFGNRVDRIYDVGVAGIHRLLDKLDRIMQAKVVVAIAGMEGALASVVGGLVDCPVVAVPTSVGYGANFEGLSALLSMLNSCASGVSVVNIDNGFGAGYFASMINHIGENE